MRKWHLVSEEMPDKGEMVLCVGSKGGYFVGYWRGEELGFYVPNCREGFRRAVAWARFDRYEPEG